jgi:hypothetical protein
MGESSDKWSNRQVHPSPSRLILTQIFFRQGLEFQGRLTADPPTGRKRPADMPPATPSRATWFGSRRDPTRFGPRTDSTWFGSQRDPRRTCALDLRGMDRRQVASPPGPPAEVAAPFLPDRPASLPCACRRGAVRFACRGEARATPEPGPQRTPMPQGCPASRARQAPPVSLQARAEVAGSLLPWAAREGDSPLCPCVPGRMAQPARRQPPAPHVQLRPTPISTSSAIRCGHHALPARPQCA